MARQTSCARTCGENKNSSFNIIMHSNVPVTIRPDDRFLMWTRPHKHQVQGVWRLYKNSAILQVWVAFCELSDCGSSEPAFPRSRQELCCCCGPQTIADLPPLKEVDGELKECRFRRYLCCCASGKMFCRLQCLFWERFNFLFRSYVVLLAAVEGGCCLLFGCCCLASCTPSHLRSPH